MNDHIFDSMVAVFSFFAIQIYVTRFQKSIIRMRDLSRLCPALAGPLIFNYTIFSISTIPLHVDGSFMGFNWKYDFYISFLAQQIFLVPV